MIYEVLESHGIDYRRFDHPPVLTCEDVRRLVPGLPGAETKNLFMCDAKGRRHFLVIVGPDKRVDLRQLASDLGLTGLRMASAHRLMDHLGVETGAVTLLALVNDPEGSVEVLFDEGLWNEEAFQCHPLVNTSTLILSKDALISFFAAVAHSPRLMVIPSRD
jgi:Ala-tRNA(Pro) deacylase